MEDAILKVKWSKVTGGGEGWCGQGELEEGRERKHSIIHSSSEVHCLAIKGQCTRANQTQCCLQVSVRKKWNLAYRSVLRKPPSTVVMEVQLLITIAQLSSGTACPHNTCASVRQAAKSLFLYFQNLGFRSTCYSSSASGP